MKILLQFPDRFGLPDSLLRMGAFFRWKNCVAKSPEIARVTKVLP